MEVFEEAISHLHEDITGDTQGVKLLLMYLGISIHWM